LNSCSYRHGQEREQAERRRFGGWGIDDEKKSEHKERPRSGGVLDVCVAKLPCCLGELGGGTVVDWPVLVGSVLASFVAGMTAAWRYASIEATKIWVEDLRHRFEVKKDDREKQKQIRHEKLDQEHALEIKKGEEERRRIGKVRKELESALRIAKEANSIRAKTLFLSTEDKQHYELSLAELRKSHTTLSRLGVRIPHNVNWDEPLAWQLKDHVEYLAKQAEKHA